MSSTNVPPSESHRALLFDSPSTRHASPETMPFSIGSLGRRTLNANPNLNAEAGPSHTNTFSSRFGTRRPSVLQEHYDDDSGNDLDRDQVLQPDYRAQQHIGSLLQTNPMSNLYTDDAANNGTSPTAAGLSNRSRAGHPFGPPSSPPRANPFGPIGMAGGGIAGTMDETEEVDLRPPPSVHDRYVASQLAEAEALLEEQGFGESGNDGRRSPKRPTRDLFGNVMHDDDDDDDDRFGTEDTYPMRSASHMMRHLDKLFALQSEIAQMHFDLEDIDVTPELDPDDPDPDPDHPSGRDHKRRKSSFNQTPSFNPGLSGSFGTDTPKSPKGTKGNPKSPKAKHTPLDPGKKGEEGKKSDDDGTTKDDLFEDQKLNKIVTGEQLSQLSILLNQFHSTPHPNLDEEFPDSPKTNEFARDMPFTPEEQEREGGGRGKGKPVPFDT